MYNLKYKIWLDMDGKVFGQGPYELLVKVKEKGSLSEAAKSMGMSYNKAFNLIKDIEGRLGISLIRSKTGGAGGGFSLLTDDAESLLQVYEKFYKECEEALNNIFHKYFNIE